MPKLTKQQATRHQQAEDLLAVDRPLAEDEKQFFLDHWQESSTSRNALDGAFFTPRGLARDLSIEVVGERIVDLGAGIGHLAFACRRLFARRWNGEPRRELVCIERNPRYVEVGRKVVPEATWICADLFDLPEGLGVFDTAIANPPFGATARTGTGPRYRGRAAEYHVIDIAAELARHGAFLVPQPSAPFRYSGRACFTDEYSVAYERFQRQTGIELTPNCGIDTAQYKGEWRGVAPPVEIVTSDFTERTTAQRLRFPR